MNRILGLYNSINSTNPKEIGNAMSSWKATPEELEALQNHKHIEKLLINNSSVKSNIQNTVGQINYYKNYDHYGGYFSLINYFMKPKLILVKIKYLIFSFLKSRKFSNNFFG